MPQRIVSPIGHSMVAAGFPGEPLGTNYRSLATARLTARGVFANAAARLGHQYMTINEGVGGETSTQMVARRDVATTNTPGSRGSTATEMPEGLSSRCSPQRMIAARPR